MSSNIKFQCIGDDRSTVIYKIDSVTGIDTLLDVNIAGDTTIGGTLSINTLSTNNLNTLVSSIGTLYTNTLSVGNLSTGSINSNIISTGSIYFSGDLYKNGELFSGSNNNESDWIKTGSDLSYTSGNVIIASLFVNSIGSHLIPSENEIFDLGSVTNRWRDLYLSGDTIYLGNTEIKATDGNILFNTELKLNEGLTIDKIQNSIYEHIWISRSASINNEWRSITWSAELGLFCAVAQTGTNTRVMTSPNGIIWTTRTSAADNNWFSISWSPQLGLFCAVANNLTSDNVMTSSNGINWTLQSSPASSIGLFIRSICWSPELGLFCAIGVSQIAQKVIITSSNGSDWTIRGPDSSEQWQSITWSSELTLFCAVSANEIIISPNGIDWTTYNSPLNNNWNSVSWSPELGLFCAVSITGSNNRVMTSPNGINWTLQTTPVDNAWRSISWASELGLFCAVSNTGTGNRVMTSPDGVNWTTRTTDDLTLVSICWSPELLMFCGVAESETDRVITSNATTISPLILSKNNFISSSDDDGFIGIIGSKSNNSSYNASILVYGNNNVTDPGKVQINAGHSNGNTIFTTNNTERLRITNSGNIGIGTSSPVCKLNISNSTSDPHIRLDGSGTPRMDFWTWPFNTNPGAYLKAEDDGNFGAHLFLATKAEGGTGSAISDRVVITSAGRVGIGLAPGSTSYQLHLSTDSAAKPSTNVWTVSSDERLKENIELADLDTCYNIIKNLPLKRYRWKDNTYTDDQISDRNVIGFIAQDVASFFPKAVNSTTFKNVDGTLIDDCLNLNETMIIRTLYGAVQKLILFNEDLQQRICKY
jgi:hypothetical protein